MGAIARRESGWPFPDLLELLESPMMGLRSSAELIRIEDYVDRDRDRYVVRAELPGIDPDKDVDITLTNGVLEIRAQKTQETRERHRSEFHYGALYRSLMLPPGVREDDVQAMYKDGVLEVSVGLETEQRAEGRKIPIQRQAEEERSETETGQ
ncbi:Hsp20/alpha crystallin family protein [Microtetraspora sp. AC03309]|uniref:Hsp20/alpha crystallin family protein n=1 Tax=Microtetraspora sp. AC03309 TaxID=2779376 RepID=UPI001E47079F|nr:Hsp20/alpha crystallin family protein [Microtetraspora sp. AC03309]MCC5579384.1 Hsp20/alpha crystallin family protein [Microtetraspora sp. AC03309]